VWRSQSTAQPRIPCTCPTERRDEDIAPYLRSLHSRSGALFERRRAAFATQSKSVRIYRGGKQLIFTADARNTEKDGE